jgi:hypothetical protein
MQLVGESEEEKEGSLTLDRLLLQQEERISKCSVIDEEDAEMVMVSHHQSQKSNES